jgi:hypothetical protein
MKRVPAFGIELDETPRTLAPFVNEKGPPTTVEPAPSAKPAATQGRSEQKASGEKTGSIPYSRHEISDPSAPGYRTNGRLFVIAADGSPRVCSATALTSTNRSLVWTAAHCVFDHDTGGWSRSLNFAPGYRSGSTPFGEWPVVSGRVLTGWTQYRDFRYDFAAVVVSPRSTGTRLQDVVGGKGIAWNYPREQAFDAFGYPVAPPFDGERLYVCNSAYGGNGPYPGTIATGCDMTEGASGGGWLVNDTYLNSNNSYKLEDYPEVIFGPYFDSAAGSLFNNTSAINPPTPSPSPTPSPTPTPTPSAAPTSTPPPSPATPPDFAVEPVAHALRLSFRLTGHLWASGGMIAVDDYAPCTRNAPIWIYRNVPSRWKLVTRTRTTNSGVYAVRLLDRPGSYYAYSPNGSVDETNLCDEVSSLAKRHRR